MDQKLENILNLALETPEEEREQTESLNVGYSAEIRSWELIVKYHGSLDRLREQNIVVEELIAGYAILTVPEALVDTVSDTPEIEYVEKPKRFYYGQTFPAGTSCFPPVTMRTPFLNGRGVLLAVLDSGITWDQEVFRKADVHTGQNGGIAFFRRVQLIAPGRCIDLRLGIDGFRAFLNGLIGIFLHRFSSFRWQI